MPIRTWLDRLTSQLLIWVNGTAQNFHENLKFVAGSNITLTPSEDVPNDANTITIAATGGGGGSSAGADNDLQIGDGAGGFKADTGNLTADPTQHNFTAGSANSAGVSWGIALGVDNAITGAVGMTFGDTCASSAEGAQARGLEATASRWFEDVHSSGADGAGVFTGHRAWDIYGSSGIAMNLLQGDTTEITLDANKTYSLHLRLIARPSSSPTTDSCREVHELLIATNGAGAALIEDLEITGPAHDFASRSVVVVISCPSAFTLRINVDPSATLEGWTVGGRVTLAEVS